MDRQPRRSPLVRLLSPLNDFLKAEASGGVLLVVASVAALAWANSPWSASYHSFWNSHIDITVAGHTLDLSLRHWLNDGLMALFFLVVGLEIKREVTTGHLATRRDALLPAAAALGGMVIPAGLYLAIAGSSAPRGWGVPMATDIALAIGLLALLGDRVSSRMRAFLLGLAIVDDIGAIIVIAAFYSSGIRWGWMAVAAVAVILVPVLQRLGVQWAGAYWVVGGITWLALYQAGVHPTLAGVVMGLLAPVTAHVSPEWIDTDDFAHELTDLSTAEAAHDTSRLARESVSVVEWLSHVLHPWTSYLIVPLFALANAGVEVSGEVVRESLSSALVWGIVVGLVVGKPLGVVVATRLAGRGQGRDGLLGIGMTAGIGFTVALFVAELAFTDPAQLAEAKLAILVASVLSGLAAALTLSRRSSRTR